MKQQNNRKKLKYLKTDPIHFRVDNKLQYSIPLLDNQDLIKILKCTKVRTIKR